MAELPPNRDEQSVEEQDARTIRLDDPEVLSSKNFEEIHKLCPDLEPWRVKRAAAIYREQGSQSKSRASDARVYLNDIIAKTAELQRSLQHLPDGPDGYVFQAERRNNLGGFRKEAAAKLQGLQVLLGAACELVPERSNNKKWRHFELLEMLEMHITEAGYRADASRAGPFVRLIDMVLKACNEDPGDLAKVQDRVQYYYKRGK